MDSVFMLSLHFEWKYDLDTSPSKSSIEAKANPIQLLGEEFACGMSYVQGLRRHHGMNSRGTVFSLSAIEDCNNSNWNYELGENSPLS
jgi:hypothetical protein